MRLIPRKLFLNDGVGVQKEKLSIFELMYGPFEGSENMSYLDIVMNRRPAAIQYHMVWSW